MPAVGVRLGRCMDVQSFKFPRCLIEHHALKVQIKFVGSIVNDASCTTSCMLSVVTLKWNILIGRLVFRRSISLCGRADGGSGRAEKIITSPSRVSNSRRSPCWLVTVLTELSATCHVSVRPTNYLTFTAAVFTVQ